AADSGPRARSRGRRRVGCGALAATRRAADRTGCRGLWSSRHPAYVRAPSVPPAAIWRRMRALSGRTRLHRLRRFARWRSRMAVMEKNPPGGQTGTGMRRDIGVVGLLFASVGSIIGSGWLFGALKASTIAGPAAIFSWLIGAVMIVLIGLTYAELGTMFPLSGGVIRFPHLSFGSFASYSMGWVNWVAAAAVAPIEVEGALQYATKYAPLTSYDKATDTHPLTGLGYVVAVIAMAAFVLINYFGVRWFARVNNVAVWWKLGMITLVVVAFMVTEFHGSNFTSHGFATDGAHGILTAIATGGIVFSYLGFRQGIELAGESNNPRRNIPIAVIGSVLITGAIYVLLQI